MADGVRLPTAEEELIRRAGKTVQVFPVNDWVPKSKEGA